MADCIIVYNGKEYDYAAFATMLHDGLLQKFVGDKVVNKNELKGDKTFLKEAVKRKEQVREKINKVVNALKKANPNLVIEEDETIVDKDGQPLAGVVMKDKDGKIVVKINPNYAGLDTPIHEAGHIFIDAIGYDNKVIQAAINQLKDTKLWSDTKKRYPNLNEKNLGKEVLAEAIGREGADIFEKDEQKSKFKQFLDYIFDKIKSLFGIQKNLAKELAKQVLAGKFEVAELEEETYEQKADRKTPKLTRSEFFSKAYERVGMQLETFETKIARLENKLRQTLTVSERKETQKKYDIAKSRYEDFEKAFKKYSFDYNKINRLRLSEGNLDNKSLDELTDLYNLTVEFDPNSDNAFLAEVKYRIAYLVSEKQREFLESKGADISRNKFEDLQGKDVIMKALGHMSEAFPELQSLSKMYDKQVNDMQTERNNKKQKLQELAKDVIAEESKNIGVKVKDFTVGNAHKFFAWMDAGNGEYISVAKARSMSDAKAKFLEFTLQLKEDYKGLQENTPAGYSPLEVIKTDPDFAEKFESSGIVGAAQQYLGTNERLRQVKIKYTDSNGKTSLKTFGEIEQELQKDAKAGKISKAIAVSKSLYYNRKAKTLLKNGVDDSGEEINVLRADYMLNKQGKLVNKFGLKRPVDFDYSRNFYAAAVQYIDDMTWNKYIQPIVPVVESIEHFNNTTGMDRQIKPNVVKWLQIWKKMHVYQERQDTLLPPEVNYLMRTLRHMTSLIRLGFNAKASLVNLIAGQQNNFRELGGKALIKGQLRMLTPTRGGAMKYSTKAFNMIKKYNVVSTDYDEKATISAKGIFNTLAQGLTVLAEHNIQGAMFLGQFSTAEWNDFDSQGNYKGSDPKMAQKIEEYKKRTSDVHGKYAAKDRRNFEYFELGKFIGQFKTWVPDWWKQRFGSRYIDRDGKEHYGSWRVIQYQGLKQIRKDIVDPDFWKSDKASAVAMRKNLRSALMMGALLAVSLGGDDDERKRKKGDILQQSIGNLTFIFNPEQAKFMIKQSAAGTGLLYDFIDALDSGIKAERYKSKSGKHDKGDLVAFDKATRLIPGTKVINDLTEEEK
jgi:hypothetical protein